jgi:RNA polymerase sigma-70 factor (ECF subfamily)
MDQARGYSRTTIAAHDLSESLGGVCRTFVQLMSQLAGEGDDVPTSTDETDIEQTLAGDAPAYERIVRRYQQQIGNYLWRFTHDRNDYEELVHNVFVEAYFSLSKFRGRGSFQSWLLTIATRVGYAYWKQAARQRRRSEVTLEGIAEPPQAESQTPDDPRLDRLEKALASLPPRDRLVLTLLHLEERSVVQAAELTGWSQTMVKVQSHRARKKLKSILEWGEK